MRARLARLLRIVPPGHDIEQGVGVVLLSFGVSVLWGVGAGLVILGIAVILDGLIRERG